MPTAIPATDELLVILACFLLSGQAGPDRSPTIGLALRLISGPPHASPRSGLAGG